MKRGSNSSEREIAVYQLWSYRYPYLLTKQNSRRVYGELKPYSNRESTHDSIFSHFQKVNIALRRAKLYLPELKGDFFS